MNPTILATAASADYELIDSGEGEKLERFGAVILSRPDPQALWKKRLPESEWNKAHGTFARNGGSGLWKMKPETPKTWQISFGGLSFVIKPTAFKHTGLFPEQQPNWQWVQEKIKSASRSVSVLNLFGYTGGATLACAAAGADVTHVDGSKVALTWARENAEASGLKDKPIRWIPDDARTFVGREIKRGKKYDAIVMDPPAFGRGPEGHVWKIEDDFLKLLDACKAILSENPLFILVNGYASGYSAVAYRNALADLMTGATGSIEIGELAIRESASDRLLPAGIFARWHVSG